METMDDTAPVAARSAPRRRRGNRHLTLFLVDIALFVVFLAAMDVPLTGIPVHEWLGIFIALATVVHLVQHGNWILTTGRRLLGATSFMNRLNYAMLILLFAAFASIVVSGLAISEAALPFLGIVPVGSDFWLWLHLASVAATVWVTALHVAFNWKWSVGALNRYIAGPLGRIVRGPS